ncbi:MAG: L-aspartate oxidase [Pseudomonadota bacterium]
MPQRFEHDVLIIGSGAAGLSLALKLPESVRAALLSKGELNQGSTYWAQGGMAAVLDEDDTIASHVEDTLAAGDGLCKPEVVEFVVSQGAAVVDWLVGLGVEFDRRETPKHSEYHLTREGGHSHRRVIHAADATGKAISRVLVDRSLARSNIEIFPDRVAVDLVVHDGRCQGAYALHSSSGQVDLFQARCVVLATGGASKAYLYTSNPDGASGDGIAMAWRAGCRVSNLEFNQFHPTCLYHPRAKSFLVTEALRGEGARLQLPDGTRFMEQFHERAELAPRDVVARAIDHEMKRTGSDCVYLDISHQPARFLQSHFPNVHRRCLDFGIDITREPIPVVPAAHYTCGGVVVNMCGQTDVGNLYAIGETASTGLHGANRMASNSLLECLVYADAAARDIVERLTEIPPPEPTSDWDETQVTNSDEDVVISHNWDELRRFMWDYVGIVRTDKRLQRALRRIDMLREEIVEYYSHYRVSNDLLELRNLASVSELMIRCAMSRRESRGLHFTLDYPDLADVAVDTVLTP